MCKKQAKKKTTQTLYLRKSRWGHGFTLRNRLFKCENFLTRMTSAPRASAPTAPLYCNAREAGNEKREKKIQAAMSDELSGCEMNHLMDHLRAQKLRVGLRVSGSIPCSSRPSACPCYPPDI